MTQRRPQCCTCGRTASTRWEYAVRLSFPKFLAASKLVQIEIPACGECSPHLYAATFNGEVPKARVTFCGGGPYRDEEPT